jgi:phage replication-related protein YjqB (UPF0714/DUF867 family)
MATNNPSTIVGVFTNREDARNATRALRDAGFSEDQIGIASSRERTEGMDLDEGEETYATEGAIGGAAAGAGVGAL